MTVLNPRKKKLPQIVQADLAPERPATPVSQEDLAAQATQGGVRTATTLAPLPAKGGLAPTAPLSDTPLTPISQEDLAEQSLLGGGGQGESPTGAPASSGGRGGLLPRGESVSERLTELLAQDSDYLKSAGTTARKASNRRGLLNSSINTQAVEAARINAALPIASQEASQAHSLRLQGRDITSREGMQQQDIANREAMQLRDIAARAGLQAEEIRHLTDTQIRDIANREGMQETELRSLLDRQQRDIESRERMQQLTVETQRFMQELDLETRERLQGLSIEAQERIAGLNIASAERNQAAALAASFEGSYADLLASIMNNPEIPAAERQRYMDHAARIRDSNLALVEQMYGITLQWSTPRGSGAPPIPTPRDRIA